MPSEMVHRSDYQAIGEGYDRFGSLERSRPTVEIRDRCKTRRCTAIDSSALRRLAMEPINAFDRPISVTASQRLNGVSPNPNPRSVEVGDILLCPPELGLTGPESIPPFVF